MASQHTNLNTIRWARGVILSHLRHTLASSDLFNGQFKVRVVEKLRQKNEMNQGAKIRFLEF